MNIKIKHESSGKIFDNVEDFALFHYNEGTKSGSSEYVVWCDLETVAIGFDGFFYVLDEIGNYIIIDEKEYTILNKKEIMDKLFQKLTESPSFQEVELNPNCSEIVFSLPGMTKEDALATLREAGIIEVDIPLKLFSGDSNDDASWKIIADRDNLLVPNLDSEFGLAHITVETDEEGVFIHGGLNLEYSAFPTMKKIKDAFPGYDWEEMTGGSTTSEFKEWLSNGMKYTNRQKKLVKYEVKKPGDDTKIAREKVIDPAFKKVELNPNCSEVVFRLDGFETRKEALEKLKEIGIFEVTFPKGEIRGNPDDDEIITELADVDNPNIPDFSCRANLVLLPLDNTEMNSTRFVDEWLHVFSYARHGNEAFEDGYDVSSENTVENGAIFSRFIEILTDDHDRKGKRLHELVYDLEGIDEDGKIYLESVFDGWKFTFEFEYTNETISKGDKFRLMSAMASAMVAGKTREEIIATIRAELPEIDKKIYYIMGDQDCQRQLFPTMKKIEDHFKGDWRGYDGGGTGSYEIWRDDIMSREIALKMLEEGKTRDEIISYLEAKLPYSASFLIDELKVSTGDVVVNVEIRDIQDDDGKRMREKYKVALNPNCSEVVFDLPGLSREEAIRKLAEIGIYEVTIPVAFNHGGEEHERTVLADDDNEMIPNFSGYCGNFDVDEWANGTCIHGEINLGDYAYPTMLKIKRKFPDGRWDDINGCDADDFRRWYIDGTPPIKTKMTGEMEKTRKEKVEPAIENAKKKLGIL